MISNEPSYPPTVQYNVSPRAGHQTASYPLPRQLQFFCGKVNYSDLTKTTCWQNVNILQYNGKHLYIVCTTALK